MATATEPRLTPKQEQVRKLLAQNKTVDEIAKKLRITQSGVYSHVRALRRLGAMPGETNGDAATATSGGSPQVLPANGTTSNVDIPELIREQLEGARAGLSEVRSRRIELERQVDSLAIGEEAATQLIERHQRALEAYTK